MPGCSTQASTTKVAATATGREKLLHYTSKLKIMNNIIDSNRVLQYCAAKNHEQLHPSAVVKLGQITGLSFTEQKEETERCNQ